MLNVAVFGHWDTDSAVAVLQQLTEQRNLSDTVFSVDDYSDLTVPSWSELAATSSVTTKTTSKSGSYVRDASRSLPQALERQSPERQGVTWIVCTAL